MNEPIDLADLETRLRQHVATLAEAPRPPSSPEHQQAADYIADHFRQLGYPVQRAAFSEAGFRGVNILTQPLPYPSSGPLVIVGAHYDSVPDSPGADDNGSAVAALLELARWIHPRLQAAGTMTGRLQLVAYDLEEYGFIGSFLHSQSLAQDGAAVRGMISLEMLGYTDQRPGSQRLPPELTGLYPDVANFIGVCGNQRSREMVQVVTEAMQSVAGLPVEHLTVPGNGETLPPVRLSDHSPFWDQGFQALMITDTSFMRNPHYHQTTDRPETLDYPFLAKVTAGVCEAVWRLLCTK